MREIDNGFKAAVNMKAKSQFRNYLKKIIKLSRDFVGLNCIYTKGT